MFQQVSVYFVSLLPEMSVTKLRFDYKTKMVIIMSNPEANCTMPASVVVESSPDGAVVVVVTGGSVP